MLNIIPSNRPNCQQILESMNKWIIKKYEVKEMKIFTELEQRLENENSFFKDFMDFKREIYMRDIKLERESKSKSNKRQKT